MKGGNIHSGETLDRAYAGRDWRAYGSILADCVEYGAPGPILEACRILSWRRTRWRGRRNARRGRGCGFYHIVDMFMIGDALAFSLTGNG